MISLVKLCVSAVFCFILKEGDLFWTFLTSYDYRSYLTLLQLRGVDIVPAETSLDILGYAAEETRDEEEKLRRLYIRARYAGEATREEAAEAARIVAFIRQQR